MRKRMERLDNENEDNKNGEFREWEEKWGE